MGHSQFHRNSFQNALTISPLLPFVVTSAIAGCIQVSKLKTQYISILIKVDKGSISIKQLMWLRNTRRTMMININIIQHRPNG